MNTLHRTLHGTFAHSYILVKSGTLLWFTILLKGTSTCTLKEIQTVFINVFIYLKKRKGLIHVFVKGCLIMWLIQVVGQSLDSTNWSLCWACNLHGQLQYISENWEVVDHSHLCLCSSIWILSFPIKGSIWVSFLAFQEKSLHISIRGQLYKAESLEPLSTVTWLHLRIFFPFDSLSGTQHFQSWNHEKSICFYPKCLILNCYYWAYAPEQYQDRECIWLCLVTGIHILNLFRWKINTCWLMC